MLDNEGYTSSNGSRHVKYGNDVLVAQKMLYALGYLKQSKPDGDFGGDTDQAVQDFQTEAQKHYSWMKKDGIIGSGTWAVLGLPEPGSERYNFMLQRWIPTAGSLSFVNGGVNIVCVK